MPGGEGEKGRQRREFIEAQAHEILLSLWKTLCADPRCPRINYLFDKRGVEPVTTLAVPLSVIKLILLKKISAKIWNMDQYKTEILGNEAINISY